jgi:hypothetical protein
MARKKLLIYALIGGAAYWLWKRKQEADLNMVAAGAAAVTSSGANTVVSPTAAATTNNMQALAGLGFNPMAARYGAGFTAKYGRRR